MQLAADTTTILATLNLHAEPGQHIVNPTDGKFFLVADTGSGNIFIGTGLTCAGSGQGSAPLFFPGVCGDGFADSELGEECDDGNATPFDGCGIPGGGANNCLICPDSTPCPDNDGNECTEAGCNASGVCDQNHTLPNSTPCTDTGNECAAAGCNGAGVCDQVHTPVQDNTPCTDDDGNECTEAGCAAGVCNQNLVLPNSKPCADDGTECAAAGCNGAGVCDQLHTPDPPSGPCTDNDGNPCTEAGCNGAGLCDQSHVMPDSKPCGDTGNECAAAGCDGAGVCDQNHVPASDGTPCTDTDQSQCTDAACVSGTCDQDAGGITQCQAPECNVCDPADGVCKAINPAPPQCGTEICPNGADDDGDGLIDCEDPDCDCEPIGEDPGKILFGKPRGAGRDKLMVHGLVLPLSDYDPMTEEIGFVLTNENGLSYTAVLQPGVLESKSGKFFHRNSENTRARNGVGRFVLSKKLTRHGAFEGYQFYVTMYGDLALATVPKMTFQIRIGDDAFVNTSDWKRVSETAGGSRSRATRPLGQIGPVRSTPAARDQRAGRRFRFSGRRRAPRQALSGAS